MICEVVVGIEREGGEAESDESGLDDTKYGVVCTRKCTIGVHFHCGRREEGARRVLDKVSIFLTLLSCLLMLNAAGEASSYVRYHL